MEQARARMTMTFETALSERAEAMADACTRCGKCVEVCPVTTPGGVNAEPVAVISGVLDILRTGDGPEVSRKWANACLLSGECLKACDYGVNPRFLLGMARVAMTRNKDEPGERRRQGVDGFRKVARDVTHISQMQLDDELLARLGQNPRRRISPASSRPCGGEAERVPPRSPAWLGRACARRLNAKNETFLSVEIPGYPAWYPAHDSFGQVPRAHFARQNCTGRMNPRGRLRISRHAGCARY